MWLGFAVKHVAKKATIGAGIIVAAVLATESGRKLAKVVTKTVAAGGVAAIEEIKRQKNADTSSATVSGRR
jgi:hypothetical protein